MEKLGIQIVLGYKKELDKFKSELNKTNESSIKNQKTLQARQEAFFTQTEKKRKQAIDTAYKQAINLENSAITKKLKNEEVYQKSWQKNLKDREVSEQRVEQTKEKNRQALEQRTSDRWNKNLKTQELAEQKRIQSATVLQEKAMQKQLENSKRFASQYAMGNVDVSTTPLSEGTIKSFKMDSSGKFEQTVKGINGELTKHVGIQNQVDGALKMTNSTIMKTNKELVATQSGFSRFASDLRHNLVKFSEYMGIGAVILGTIQGIKDAVNSVVILDKSMTGLAKVTNESESSLKSYQSTIYDTGKELGALAEEVVDATSVFARAGYSLSESSELGKSAILLSNVADSFQDVSTSGEQIISILKGFNLGASESVRVVDLLNEVSNKFNVKNTDLSEGLKRTSATMSGFGNDIDETTALLSGSTEVLGNWEKSSRGIMTIGRRIRGLTEDGEKDGEMFATNAKLAAEFGVVLINQDDTFRSTYDVIQDIAKASETFGKQDPTKFQYLLQQLAGGDQLPVLTSLIQNIDGVTAALEASKNSAGSAEKENAKFLLSIEGRMKTAKVQTQEFYSTLISSDAIKTAVTGWGNFIEILTSLTKTFGAMPLIIGTATFALALFNKELLITSGLAFANFFKDIAFFATRIPTLILTIQKLGFATVATTATIGGLSLATIGLLGGVALLGVGLVYLAKKQKEHADAIKKSAEESVKQTQAFNDNQSSAKTLITSLSDLAGVKKLNADQGKRINEVTTQMNSLFPGLFNNLDTEGGKLEGLVQRYNEVTKAALVSQSARMNTDLLGLNQDYKKESTPTMVKLGLTGKLSNKLSEENAVMKLKPTDNAITRDLQDSITAKQTELNKLNDQIYNFKGVSIESLKANNPPPYKPPGGTPDKGDKTPTEDVLKQLDSYRQKIEDVTHALTILGSQQQMLSDTDYPNLQKSQEAMIAQYKLEQEAIRQYGLQLRSAIDSGKYVGEELQNLKSELASQSEKWWAVSASIAGAEKAIKGYADSVEELAKKDLADKVDKASDAFSKMSDILDSTKKSIDSQHDSAMSAIEDQIEALDRQTNATNDLYERTKLLADEEEKRAKLANTLQEKNVKLYTGVGATGWEFVADPQAVQSAQQALTDSQTAIREFDIKQAQDAEKQKLEDAKSALQKTKEAEQQAFETRKANFENFQNNIEDAMKNGDKITLEMRQAWLETMTLEEQTAYAQRIADVMAFVKSYNDQLDLMQIAGYLPSYGGETSSRGGGVNTGDSAADRNRDAYLAANPGARTVASMDAQKNVSGFNADGVSRGMVSKGLYQLHDNEGVFNAGQMANVAENFRLLQGIALGRTPNIVSKNQSTSTGTSIVVQNVNLPGVKNADDFITKIQEIKTYSRNAR